MFPRLRDGRVPLNHRVGAEVREEGRRDVDGLRAVIPAARLAKYVSACDGTGVDPLELYRWAARVSLTIFDDIGSVEVAMRSAIAESLRATYGDSWYRRADLLDSPTLTLIDRAWRQGRLGTLSAGPDVVHGKLVATLMFGFWVKVLGRGAFYVDATGARHRRIYDTLLWKPAVRHAFPNVGATDRAMVEAAAHRIQEARNRIAHHEHVIWGVPMPGQRTPDGAVVRVPLGDLHQALLDLAGYIDAGFAAWLQASSQYRTVLGACPLQDRGRLLL